MNDMMALKTIVANVGVPSLSSDGPANLTLLLERCANITLHAKAGSGHSDVVITQASCQAANFQPINNVAFTAESPFYEGVTIAWTDGSTLEMGFNGGPLPNGDTLTINRLLLGQTTRKDVAGGGEAG